VLKESDVRHHQKRNHRRIWKSCIGKENLIDLGWEEEEISARVIFRRH
jgi:hypothetical protein